MRADEQNFTRAFDIAYCPSGGQRELSWRTSRGTSTRMVGGLVVMAVKPEVADE